MFENYVTAKTTKRRKWVTILLSVSFAAHAIAVVALIIHGFWVIDKLTPPKRELALAIAPPPPPPPPPPKASKKKKQPKTDKKVVKKIRPTDTTQPVEKKKEDPDVEVVIVDEAEGEEDGVDLGQGMGSMEGLGLQVSVPGKKFAAPPPPPPPPPPPKVVPPKAIDAQRVSGNKNIMPDEATKMQIQRDGNTRIVASVKLCISKTGSVSSTRVVKSSGYPAYDRKITGQMRQWRYAPFMINGKPSPVCSSVMFVYVQN
jgi:protein TonB